MPAELPSTRLTRAADSDVVGPGDELVRELHELWETTVAYLAPVRPLLGTAYRPVLVLYVLAMAKARAADLPFGEGDGACSHVDLFAARWELACVVGVSADYVGRTLAATRSGSISVALLRALVYHQEWHTQGLDARTFVGGLVFRLRTPCALTPALQGAEAVAGEASMFAPRYRDLLQDIRRQHTALSWAAEGRLPENRRGQKRNLGRSSEVPEGPALDMLQHMVDRACGYHTGDGEDLPRLRYDTRTLLSLLRQPPRAGREPHTAAEEWVDQVAAKLLSVLEDDVKNFRHWLMVAWGVLRAYRQGDPVWRLPERALADVVLPSRALADVRNPSALMISVLTGGGFYEAVARLKTAEVHPVRHAPT